MQHESMTLADVLKMIARPAERLKADPLPPGERCPLIGRGCGASNVCRYGFSTSPDPGSYAPKFMDGQWVTEQVSTTKGKIDGRCLTKQEALRRINEYRKQTSR